MHSGRKRSPGIRQTQIHPLDCQTVKSSLQRTSFHCSRIQWWQALHHSSRRLALHMVILGMWNPFHEAPNEQFLCWRCFQMQFWNSVVRVTTEDRWFFTELFSKVILLPMFVYGDCMALCSILYTCQQRVAEIAESTNLKGCSHTFVYIA